MSTLRLITGHDTAVIPGDKGPARSDGPGNTDERRRLRVLVIDDDDEDAALTQRALAEIPWFICTVDCANSYGSALQLMRTNQYDVILLDHGLGAKSGLELLEEAFGSTLNVAVVLLTGMASHQVDEAASRAGIAHLLEKSELRAGPLERSVRYALERTRIEQELRSTRAFFRSAFDALSDNVAILDERGRIIEVNRAWQQFADLNEYADANAGRGDSYLQVCDVAALQGDGTAKAVASNLRRMLTGELEGFALLYRCDSPDEERWFNVDAARVRMDGAQRVMVAHKNVTERLRAERKLRESADGYMLLFNSNPSPLWVADDATTRCVAVNDAALALYEYTRDEFLKLTAYDLVPPDQRHLVDRARAARPTGLTNLGSKQHVTKAGKTIDVDLMMHSIELNGHPCQFMMATDITERVRADRASAAALASLEFERNRLSGIFERAPAFMAVLRGPTHIVEMANDEFARLTGRSSVGIPAIETYPEATAQGLFALVDHVRATGLPYVGTHLSATFRPPSGDELTRIVNFVIQPLAEADGAIPGVLIHGVDVTNEVASANALRESEEQYRTLVELSPDGILIHVDGAIVFANGSAARVLHAADPSELLGRSMLDLVHPESAALEADRLERLARGETLDAVEMRWITVDGQARHMELASVSFDHGGRRAVHTVFRDTTVNRQLEEQLRQSQKMEAVGQLAGGVAHDFNNLLTVIKGSVEFLLEDVTGGPQYRDDVMEIRNAAERAAALTRQLLAFSRTQILERRVLDVNAVIRSVQPMLSRLIREDISLKTTLAPTIGPIEADPGQVEQVILNLALNARDAMPHGGLLSIETSEVRLMVGEPMEGAFVAVAGQYVVVSVTDTGVGIPSTVRARIFEPFFTTKAVGHGTGLGLATVHGIVKQSGGYLSIDTTMGVGTTFQIFLPVVALPITAREDVAPAADTRGIETVLVVEDMDAVREIACRVLARHGYTVLQARNGQEALELTERLSQPIHLLLTDVVMPEMNGVRLAEALSRTRPAMQVLFMSGYAEDAVTRHAVEDAGALFVPKPFSPAVLLQRVREALDAATAS